MGLYKRLIDKALSDKDKENGLAKKYWNFFLIKILPIVLAAAGVGSGVVRTLPEKPSPSGSSEESGYYLSDIPLSQTLPVDTPPLIINNKKDLDVVFRDCVSMINKDAKNEWELFKPFCFMIARVDESLISEVEDTYFSKYVEELEACDVNFDFNDITFSTVISCYEKVQYEVDAFERHLNELDFSSISSLDLYSGFTKFLIRSNFNVATYEGGDTKTPNINDWALLDLYFILLNCYNDWLIENGVDKNSLVSREEILPVVSQMPKLIGYVIENEVIYPCVSKEESENGVRYGILNNDGTVCNMKFISEHKFYKGGTFSPLGVIYGIYPSSVGTQYGWQRYFYLPDFNFKSINIYAGEQFVAEKNIRDLQISFYATTSGSVGFILYDKDGTVLWPTSGLSPDELNVKKFDLSLYASRAGISSWSSQLDLTNLITHAALLNVGFIGADSPSDYVGNCYPIFYDSKSDCFEYREPYILNLVNDDGEISSYDLSDIYYEPFFGNIYLGHNDYIFIKPNEGYNTRERVYLLTVLMKLGKFSSDKKTYTFNEKTVIAMCLTFGENGFRNNVPYSYSPTASQQDNQTGISYGSLVRTLN